MSDQDEVMRLSAEIVNRWSGPLTDMRRDLRKLADDVKGTHTAGVTHAKKHGEAVSGLRKEFQRLDDHIKSTSLETMAVFGVSALSVAGAVSAMKDAVFGFGDFTRQMTFLRRETGLAIDQLRQYEALARRVGAAPGAMSKGIQNFAQHMQNLRRMTADELNAWSGPDGADKGTNQFVLSLRRLNNADALSAAIGFLDKIPSPVDKKKYLRLFGLPENLADVPVSELRKSMAEIQKSIGNVGPDAEKSALKFEAAIDRMNEAVQNLKVTVGTELVGAFTDATKEIHKFIDQNRTGLIADLKDVSTGIHTALEDLRTLVHAYREFRGEGGPALNKFLWGKDQAPAPFQNLWPDRDKMKELGVPQWNPFSGGGDYSVPPVFSPMAYHPGANGLRSGGGFQVMGTGSSSGSPEEVIARGTHIGVLQALRESRYEMEGGGDAAGGGGMGGMGGMGGGGMGGLSPAAYHPSGSAGLPMGGGGGAHRLSSGASRQFSIGDIHDALTGGGEGPAAAIQNGTIASSRARFAQELQDPNKRMEFAAMLLSEGTPLPTAESAMNRSLFANKTLSQMLHSGFYGPINRGQLPAFMAQLRANPKLMAQMNTAINRALGGSDTVHGATDQGMFSDPNGRWTGGRTIIGHQVFNDWGSGPGGHAGAARWREAFERMARASRGAGAGGGVWAAPGYTAEMYSPFGLHGEALRHHFGYRGHGGQVGKQSGMGQGGQLKGSAHLAIDFKGMPKGTRTKLAHSGFSEVRLNRGRTMTPASQDS